MRITAIADAHAVESVAIAHFADLDQIALRVDGRSVLTAKGSPAQRADFLRRLATEATRAADELVPRLEVEGVPGLAVGA